MASRALRRDPAGTALALVFLALGGFMVVRSGDMTAMGAVFPRAIGIAMAVFSVALIARNLLLPAKTPDHTLAETPAKTVPVPGGSGPGSPSQWRRLALVGILVAWTVAMTRIGFFATAALAMMALVFVASFQPLSPRQILVYALSILVIAIGSYLLFVRGLLVPTPAGFLI